MAKLTMGDVDKRLEDIRTRARPVERPNIIGSLLERSRRTRLPKKPKLPGA